MDLQRESGEPFWVDDPFPYQSRGPSHVTCMQRVVLALAFLMRLVLLFTLYGLMVFLARYFPALWIVIAASILLSAWVYLRVRLSQRGERARARATRIQALAKARTGADVIGSAIHTAGHPLLQPNQPVVLALHGDQLSIHEYQSADPIDRTSVDEIQELRTISLDDDLQEHIDVVDKTAQALLLLIAWRVEVIRCRFRRMYVVRAIGWYEALERARKLSVPPAS